MTLPEVGEREPNDANADWLAAVEDHLLDAIAWSERAEADRQAAEAGAFEAALAVEYWRAAYSALQSEAA